MHSLLTTAGETRYLLRTYARLLNGLDDSHRALEPHAGAKTAGWILGHLCVTGDFARKLCGRTPICPKEWRPMYNPGTQPSADATTYPPMADLVATYRRVYEDLVDAATQADAATLDAPNPFTPTVGAFPLSGDFVGYMLGGHLGYHLGQLHAWRYAAGLGSGKT